MTTELYKDKGWAWMVCFATFMIYLIHPSYFYVTSALFLDFMDIFDTSAAMVNVILAMTNVVYCVSAFVLVNLVMPHVSIKQLTTVCSIVYALATLAVVVSPTLPVFFTVCVIKYIAQGGVLVPSLTIVGMYFERRRALATSLSLLGISVAALMVPPVITYLRREYGFRGSFLLLSAYEMQSIIAGMLLRSVPSGSHLKLGQAPNASVYKGHTADVEDDTARIKLLSDSQDQHKLNVPGQIVCQDRENLQLVEKQRLAYDSLETFSKTSKTFSSTESSLKNNLNLEDAGENYKSNLKKPKDSPRLLTRLKVALDFSLLRDYVALFYLLSFGLNHSGAFIATYLPSYAIKSGLSPPDAALLMTIAGSCDAASRVAYGYLADLRVVRPSLILASACLVLGVTCQMITLYTSLGTFAIFAVVYGCCGMAHLSLNTPLIVDLLGISRLGKVLALGALASSSFISAQFPIHGVLIEVTGNFTASFYWIGGTFILSSLYLFVEPWVRKLQDKKTSSNSLGN